MTRSPCERNTNALASIREDLGATIQSREWTVNGYTATAVLVPLIAGAALLTAFLGCETRVREPTLPLRCSLRAGRATSRPRRG